MNNKDKKVNKFKFVTLDENNEIIEDNSFLDVKEDLSFEEIKTKEFENKSLKDLVDESLKKPRVVPSPEELDKTEEFKSKKIYVSFETRIAIRIIVILLLFLAACYFIIESLNYSNKNVVNYNEITEANYNVCENNSNYYFDSKCQAEGLKYNQDKANFIPILFKYNVDYSQEVPYDIAYHVIATTKVFDKENNTKIIYKNEDVLVERTSISDIANKIFFDSSINIEYKKYNNIAKENADKYGSGSDSTLEVTLYLDKDDETLDVASVTIPLNESNFSIRKSALSNLNQYMELDNEEWNDYNSMCAVIATILIILSLIILYRTTRLVLKVTNNKSQYEKALVKLLRDYDDDIIVAKDGYVVDSYKKIIKVAEFKELLDARHLLNKPIIYSKVNPVKSEFIVEDESKVFKFVLKDSDF